MIRSYTPPNFEREDDRPYGLMYPRMGNAVLVYADYHQEYGFTKPDRGWVRHETLSASMLEDFGNLNEQEAAEILTQIIKPEEAKVLELDEAWMAIHVLSGDCGTLREVFLKLSIDLDVTLDPLGYGLGGDDNAFDYWPNAMTTMLAPMAKDLDTIVQDNIGRRKDYWRKEEKEHMIETGADHWPHSRRYNVVVANARASAPETWEAELDYIEELPTP